MTVFETLDPMVTSARCAGRTPSEHPLRDNTITAAQKKQTHCHRGHPLSGDNLYVHNGCRQCLTCKREAGHRSYRKRPYSERSDEWRQRYNADRRERYAARKGGVS